MKSLYILCAICAILSAGPISAEDMTQVEKVEETTESPIADMALVDPKENKMTDNMDMKAKKPAEAQPHTIADFIIHPLIALKPRPQEEEPNAEGKQASDSSTTPSPWQLFGFNPGQGLISSSMSSLAGSVGTWLNNRIPIPGLVDTPVRESTSTSTTTTTTPRPDVVVRVQQRKSTRKPMIAIDNENRPFRNRRKRPNRFNNIDSDEYNDEYDEDDDDDFDDNNNNNNNHNNDDDDEDDDDSSNENNNDENEGSEDEEHEEEEEHKPVRQQNNNVRRRPRPMNHNNNNNWQNNNQRRRFNNNNQRKRNQKRRQPQESEEVEEEYDDDEEEQEQEQEDDDQDFYYDKNQKRSQNEQNFIQRGQQNLLKQIRQFTRGQTPAEIGDAMRKSEKISNNMKRRQQATLIINRNGQTIYVAPELLQANEVNNNKIKPTSQQYQYYQPSVVSSTTNKRPVSGFPQPPLTIPYKRKGKPTQYITIPWSQLGISPPDQVLALTEGLQSQPLILNIPQSAINAMQNPRPSKKKQAITAEAVPLLADASIMDIFKPPRIPPARTPSNVKPNKKAGYSTTPVVIASQSKPGRQRIRPGTIVEKAPADEDMAEQIQASESMSNNSDSTQQFIVVGEDGEAGIARNTFQYLDYLRRGGRQLNANAETVESQQQSEQLIPVQIIADEKTTVVDKVEPIEEAKVDESLVDPAMTISDKDAKQEKPLEDKVEAPAIIKPEALAQSSHTE